MKISRNARRSLAWGYVPALAAFVLAWLLTDISVWALLLFAWIGAAVLTLVVAFARQETARRRETEARGARHGEDAERSAHAGRDDGAGDSGGKAASGRDL